MNNPAALQQELNRLAMLLNQKQAELEKATTRWAVAERDYRIVKRTAWVGLRPQKLTVPEKEAEVDGITADARFKRDEAEGQKANYLEAVRNLRQQMSAVQTLGAVMRTEMDMAR